MIASAPAERLIDAADRLFYAQGYGQTGVNQLVAEAGVAKASFYHHFPSKERLLAAYLERRHAAWFERLGAAVAGGAGPAVAVEALFDALEAWLAETAFRGCAFLNVSAEMPALSEAVRSQVATHKEAQRAFTRALIARGAASPDGAAETGDAVHLLFEGAIAEARVVRDLWPVSAARTAALRLVAAR